jgi:hypothetical protein
LNVAAVRRIWHALAMLPFWIALGLTVELGLGSMVGRFLRLKD